MEKRVRRYFICFLLTLCFSVIAFLLVCFVAWRRIATIYVFQQKQKFSAKNATHDAIIGVSMQAHCCSDFIRDFVWVQKKNIAPRIQSERRKTNKKEKKKKKTTMRQVVNVILFFAKCRQVFMASELKDYHPMCDVCSVFVWGAGIVASVTDVNGIKAGIYKSTGSREHVIYYGI